MTKISKLIALVEAFSLDTISSSDGNTTVSKSDIVSAFVDRMKEFGIEDVQVSVAIDFADGIAVKFTDAESDSVVVLFQIINDGESIAEVIYPTDSALCIDLTPVSPSVIAAASATLINLTNLSWMNKSTMTALFKAGKVGVNEEEGTAAQLGAAPVLKVGAVLGNRLLKLPYVRKSKLTGEDKKNLMEKIKSNCNWF